MTITAALIVAAVAILATGLLFGAYLVWQEDKVVISRLTKEVVEWRKWATEQQLLKEMELEIHNAIENDTTTEDVVPTGRRKRVQRGQRQKASRD